MKTKNLPKEGVFGGKNPPKKEPRAKYCIKWLLMLYYEGSRLNGLWSPFGIETSSSTTVALVEKKEEPSPPGSVNQRAISYVRWACKVVAACSKVAMVKSWVGPRRRL